MAIFTRTTTRTNPAFYADRLRLVFQDQPERLQRMIEDPDSTDLLTWNVFSSLDTHRDQDWLAHRLQPLGGPGLRAPVRISLFSGRTQMPYLTPSPAYVRFVEERSAGLRGGREALGELTQPIEVPVRIETPDVLLLVDTAGDQLRSGAGGRDRLIELVDTGLEHARRLGTDLSVGLISAIGATAIGDRVRRLRDAAQLADEVPWRSDLPPVGLGHMTWAELLALWDQEAAYLDLAGQPVRAFRAAIARRGLR